MWYFLTLVSIMLVSGVMSSNEYSVTQRVKSLRGITKTAESAPPISGQIVFGQKAVPGQFPWQVRMTSRDNTLCGGTLIDPDWVLTAAHCVDGVDNITLFLGSMMLSEYETTKIRMDIPNSAIFSKSGFNNKTYENDLALIKLPWPAPMPTRDTDPILINEINLPAASMRRTNLTNKVATISGWGRTSDNGNRSPTLLYSSNRIISYKECRSKSSLGSLLLNSTICTDTSSSAACNGDSGGGLVMQVGTRWTLIGVLSFGDRRGCVNGPNGFTNVAYFLDWIRRTM